METATLVNTIEQKVNELLEGHASHFLVEVRVKPTNNIKVFIDADEGIPLSNLISYNRALYKKIEEAGTFPDGDFSLEVSSPGLDEPLKKHRQYKKNIGRYIELVLNDSSKIEGKLLEVSEEGVLIETEKGKGKKKEINQEKIGFDQIKTTKIQIKF